MSLRDEFFWLGEINKATLVINSRQGLLPMPIALEAAKALREVLAEGEADPTKRAKTYITFEPLMLKKAGPEITLMHAGRSSQDMHATYRSALLRDHVLEVYNALDTVKETLTALADKNRETVVPNYTNGVAAQPNSLAHYFLAFLAGFNRDAEKMRQFYARLDRCPMGSTVLNGTCWPLDRKAMAERLGFAAVAENAYDATQIGQSDLPCEFASILAGICLHINVFLEDLMVQYAQARPWILLQEGGDNTYVSSAMPQKRNPGLVNNCRTEASSVIGEAQAEIFRAHNLQSGMIDPKTQGHNGALAQHAVKTLTMFNRVLNALVINKDRALQELNSDWTASQEVADRLMKEYGVPFRIGHHVASKMVGYARANNVLPLQFPHEKMREIYREVIETEYPEGDPELPMSEQEFKDALNPVSIVHNRKTLGGPQPEELQRMLAEQAAENKLSSDWAEQKSQAITTNLSNLDQEFNKLGE